MSAASLVYYVFPLLDAKGRAASAATHECSGNEKDIYGFLSA